MWKLLKIAQFKKKWCLDGQAEGVSLTQEISLKLAELSGSLASVDLISSDEVDG